MKSDKMYMIDKGGLRSNTPTMKILTAEEYDKTFDDKSDVFVKEILPSHSVNQITKFWEDYVKQAS